ncbi:MAG TPA: hypothetical protein VFE47_06445 [Tepidisphaeraceae bacterium]|jgi:hypothetical protein|nr:hypothetical protein [Tepidisphaeraceae bacterium]
MLGAPDTSGNLVFVNGSFDHVDWDEVHAAPASIKRVTFKSSILNADIAAWLDKQESVERISIVGCTHFDRILRSPILQARVVGLSLFDLCLNEDDVRLIEKFSQLSGLGLEGSHISDQEVIDIAAMKSLRMLGIHDTLVSREAVLKIREAHPTLILDTDVY